MVQGNTLQSTGYQSVRQYIYLQITQYKVQQPRGGCHGLKTYSILQYKSYTHTQQKLQMAEVHNTNHIFTYMQQLRRCSH